MRALWMKALMLPAVLLSGCSLVVGGFEECTQDGDCEGGRICQTGYCVVDPVPEGCGRTEGAVDVEGAMPLGAALPLTPDGQTDQSEVMGLNALLIGLDEVNQRDPFVLHVCDSAGDPQRVQAQVTWLTEQMGAKAVVTSGSGQTIAAASAAVPLGTLVMTATATSPELTVLQDQGLVWRTAPSDAIQGAVIADLLLNGTAYFDASSVQKVGLVSLNDPYGQGLTAVLIDAFEGQTKTLSTHQYERAGSIDNIIDALDAADPDVTVLVAFPDDAARILNAATTRANLAPVSGHRWFFTDSAKDPALMRGLTTNGQIEGALGTAPAQGAGPAYTQFATSFVSRFRVDPAQFSFTSHSYDAMYLLALGSMWAKGADGTGEVTGARIAEGLRQLSAGQALQFRPTDLTAMKAALQQGQTIDVRGASGELDFNPDTGEAPSPIEVWRVVGEGFETVEAGRQPPPP